MKKFVRIAAAVIVVGLAGLLSLGIWWTGPPLVATVAFPSQIFVDHSFYITIDVTNPHPDTVELDNIEIPTRILDFVDITGVRPPIAPGSPFDFFGIRVWKFDTKVPPGASVLVELSARATGARSDEFEIGVCNQYEDCTRVKKSIIISHEFLESPGN